MKYNYRKRPTERLHQWVARLADEASWPMMETEERRVILSEVSKQSYIEGVRAIEEIDRKARSNH